VDVPNNLFVKYLSNTREALATDCAEYSIYSAEKEGCPAGSGITPDSNIMFSIYYFINKKK